MSQSLRVPVVLLIANAEAKRERIVAEHRKLKDAYKAKPIGEYRQELADALAQLAIDIENGHLRPQPSDSFDDKTRQYTPAISARARVRLPAKPPKTADTAKVDRHLRLLRSTAQDTVSVRTDDDFAAYL